MVRKYWLLTLRLARLRYGFAAIASPSDLHVLETLQRRSSVLSCRAFINDIYRPKGRTPGWATASTSNAAMRPSSRYPIPATTSPKRLELCMAMKTTLPRRAAGRLVTSMTAIKNRSGRTTPALVPTPAAADSRSNAPLPITRILHKTHITIRG